MDRDTWLTAALMVETHGTDAFDIVELKLKKMRQDGVDEYHFRYWCWIARAVLEITRLEPSGAQAVHRGWSNQPTARLIGNSRHMPRITTYTPSIAINTSADALWRSAMSG